MNDLLFIEDEELRGKVVNSIEYSYVLHELAKREGHSDLFKEETNRVIILYVISSIEAILFYFFKIRNEKISVMDYKYPQLLPKDFNHKDKEGSLVIAVQTPRDKKEYEIGLKELVVYFSDLKLIKKETIEKLMKLNDLRNTHHLAKSRTKKCDIDEVENAFKLLIHTLESAPKSLITKKS